LAESQSDASAAARRSLVQLDRQAGIRIAASSPGKALEVLRDRTGTRLLFSPSLLPDSILVECPCEDRTVRQALDQILEGTGFRFTTIGNHVLIEPDPAQSASGDTDAGILSEPVFALARGNDLLHGGGVIPVKPLLQGRVVGVVTESGTGRPLATVQITVEGTGIGTLTDNQGRYLLLNVPEGQVTIVAQLIGFATASQVVTVRANETVTVNFALTPRAISLGGLVVTGVAAETPRNQLAFTVDQVDVSAMQKVPTPDVGGLLRGKVAGAKVVQGSGLPGSEPSFQLRGPTSITGSQEPLIVIDGVITHGGISDLNPQDIASMEIVKGAAAAALYGSRAQAGVVQITTRSGTNMAAGRHTFSLRTTFEKNDIEKYLGVNRSHWYRMNADGTAFLDHEGNEVLPPIDGGALAFDDGGPGTDATRAFADKPFPIPTANPIAQFFDPGNRWKTDATVSGRTESGTSYFLSASTLREEGAIRLKPPMKQHTFRLNVTQPIGEDFRITATTYLSDRERHLVQQQGGFLRQLTFTSAAADLLKKDPTQPGGISHIGEPILIDNVGPNPVNRLINTTHVENRVRFMGGLNASYALRSWLTVDANVSIDRIFSKERYMQRPGLGTLNGPPTVGSIRNSENVREEMNASLTLSANRAISDRLVVRSRARWLAESQSQNGFSAAGSGLPVDMVPRLGTVTGTPSIDSYERTTRTEGFFLINSFVLDNRYVGDFLVRRDGSSLFGENERWQTYWRLSAAWRLAQEPWFGFDWLTEFKPRYSIGTAGGRPSFSAQYQTYAIDRGQIVPRTLGNADLRPELATEQEWGVDMVIKERLQIQANYVDTKVEDQLLLVPLPSVEGFEAQWRNAGTVRSKTWELSLEAALVERPGLQWTVGLNLDRTKSKITELNMPPYEITNPGSSRARMLVREGEALGSFYGFKFLSSCEELPSGMPCDEFDVNDMGHLVWVGAGNTWKDGIRKNLWGTTGVVNGREFRWGHPIRPDPDSPLAFTKLGDSQPDLNASLLQNLQWGRLGITFLLEGEWGAQVYNMTQQWQCRDGLCDLADMRGVPDERKKPISYFGVLQAANAANDFFAEDADYVKVRELSLRYTLPGQALPASLRRLGLSEMTINLTGRNLKTWTKYRGFDPEVGTATFGGSAAMGRVDEWFYPNFRSVGIDVQIVF
jgi:TonB-linked SusC/RagA family outer membrane protein